ncbi:MAG: hypothetical protein M3301_03540, partial [Chloroflexota bacterium]|nr:hypothetical protein [Chloroflexota bacterium]
MAVPPEYLEYVARHPGGFDEWFFGRYLEGLRGEFVSRMGIEDGDVEIVVRLRNGREVVTEHARTAATWAAFVGKEEWVIAPYREVDEVLLRRREADTPAGF